MSDHAELGCCACPTCHGKIEQQQAEIERLRHYNESVAVCEKHTPDVIKGDCLVCEIERYKGLCDKWEAEYAEQKAEIERLTAEGTRKQERIDELEVRCQELGTLYEQWKETSHKQNELLDMYAERPSSESETIGWCKSCGSDNLELWMADGSAYVCKRCGFEKDHHCTDPMCGPLNSEQEQT